LTASHFLFGSSVFLGKHTATSRRTVLFAQQHAFHRMSSSIVANSTHANFNQFSANKPA
jgi:hypothetical protein